MIKVVIKFLKELLWMLLARVSWAAVVERFAVRLVIYLLEKLRDRYTNTVTQETVDDIIEQLKGKRLQAAEEYQPKTHRGGKPQY